MSPIRRYLRITKYSVLEVRIYLEKPSDSAWLLSSREPVLQRIVDAVRPLVLPKLREENENAKRKGSKKQRGIKDVVSHEDFEITIFLTELSTRHSLLIKQKQFAEKPKLRSNSNKLTGWLNNDSANPITVEDDDEGAVNVLREDTGEVSRLENIPEADGSSKRKAVTVDDDEEEEEPLFVSSDDEEFFATQRARKNKRQKAEEDRLAGGVEVVEQEEEEGQDVKKKLAMDTSYQGFSIYGRILCLLVKRKGKKALPAAGGAPVGGSQMMEEWVSTQAAQEAGFGDDEEG